MYPDVEFLCGGVNHQTPTSAGLWRQGNLLHFGFEQSPAEMNESGKLLLLNAISYISHFTDDRPIAITPSPFAGAVVRRSCDSRALAAKPSIRNGSLPEPACSRDLEGAIQATGPRSDGPLGRRKRTVPTPESRPALGD